MNLDACLPVELWGEIARNDGAVYGSLYCVNRAINRELRKLNPGALFTKTHTNIIRTGNIWVKTKRMVINGDSYKLHRRIITQHNFEGAILHQAIYYYRCGTEYRYVHMEFTTYQHREVETINGLKHGTDKTYRLGALVACKRYQYGKCVRRLLWPYMVALGALIGSASLLFR